MYSNGKEGKTKNVLLIHSFILFLHLSCSYTIPSMSLSFFPPLPSICTNSFIPTYRVSRPGTDEREGQDHPWATGFSVSEEGGGETMLSLLQAFNHLYQGFWRKASSHQGEHAYLGVD